ncbi:TfoX/Sxy family protein [Pararhodobacter sp.]|uniref:TfoX/Sxy family protein n=1 Tax=Pararhodobacter sp. TaxID=2127056 RepID=UPI002AFDD541|nr:TfoX/Sxy family protein [Pararhodobacter sp.]
MAYDEGLADILRDALHDTPGIAEKKMFGGLVFMMDGNMLCGVHKGGGMFRVGMDNIAAALAVDGTQAMAFTGRPMRGFVDVTDETVADDDRRATLINLAKGFVSKLPTK